MSESQNLLARTLGIPVDEGGSNASIFNLDEWDSVGHVRVILEIEKEIGRELDSEEVLSLESVSDVAQLLTQNRLHRGA